jgi:Toprim domain-containing protein
MGQLADRWRERFDRWLVREEALGEYRAFCPLHEDPDTSKTPSASFNFEMGKFNCFSRCGGYSITNVWKMVQAGETPERRKAAPQEDEVAARRARRAKAEGTQTVALPTEGQLDEWHQRLVGKPDMMRDLLTRRGLQRSTLARFKLGWDGERLVIPVRDPLDTLVNVRRYAMGSKANKMVNWPGYGDAALWGLDALKMPRVVLTEGEMDAILGRQYKFPTLSPTAGAGTWLPEWNVLFVSKDVYICYDVDEQGEAGARKVANQLRQAANRVFIMKLPLTAKGADLTDYFVNQGYGRQNFIDLMKATPPYRDRKVSRNRAVAEIPEVRMRNSFDPSLMDVPISMVATVSGRSATPASLPRSYELNCGQDWQKTKCAVCPMDARWGGSHKGEVSADDRLLLKMLDLPDDKRTSELLSSLDIPRTCPKVDVHLAQQWRVDELAVVPNIDDPEEGDGEQVLRRIFNVTEEGGLTPVNTTARLTGVSTAGPKDGRMVFHSWGFEQTQTSLDRFEMTEELRGALDTVFQPGPAQDPIEKLRELARDLAANVTHIYGRPELHIAYDLVWHSVLDFTFRGNRIGKGWLELLVMGDTRTGKSEAAERLRSHYQCGVLKSCEGATLAGLVGGAQQIGNNWVITWGTIPLQDRRLVILDEVSGISDKNIIEQMSAVRSSGRAQISKIVSQETFARTRTIWISNPPDGRPIQQTNNGAIDAIQKLITNPEDIARFDFALVAAQEDVDSSIINAATPPRAPHRATKELCSALVTWAWSRKPDQVVWSRGTERHVLACAEELGKRYIADPPLIQPENVRVKLARLAVAVAARLFSHDGDGEKVLVCNEHVDAAVALLDEMYGKRWFGYGDHSRKEIRAKAAAKEFSATCRGLLISNEGILDTLKTVINDTQFRARDFQEFGGMDQELAGQTVNELLKMGMVRRRSKGYINMMPELIRLVRELEEA